MLGEVFAVHSKAGQSTKLMAQKTSFKTFYALSVAWQLGFLIALPIGGFLLLGFLADKYLRTEPLLLVISLFTGLAITVYEVYNLFVPLIKNKENDA